MRIDTSTLKSYWSLFNIFDDNSSILSWLVGKTARVYDDVNSKGYIGYAVESSLLKLLLIPLKLITTVLLTLARFIFLPVAILASVKF